MPFVREFSTAPEDVAIPVGRGASNGRVCRGKSSNGHGGAYARLPDLNRAPAIARNTAVGLLRRLLPRGCRPDSRADGPRRNPPAPRPVLGVGADRLAQFPVPLCDPAARKVRSVLCCICGDALGSCHDPRSPSARDPLASLRTGLGHPARISQRRRSRRPAAQMTIPEPVRKVKASR